MLSKYRKRESACKSTMYLMLCTADSYHYQYDAQSTAISNICKYVLCTIGVTVLSDVMEIPNELFLQCKVFT